MAEQQAHVRLDRFNSSGYYREHLYALFNLVDFSMDEVVREKAKVVTNLLLFDACVTFHKTSIGACGGRSQFKSRCNGWDNALSDVDENVRAEEELLVMATQDGCHFATSTIKYPMYY